MSSSTLPPNPYNEHAWIIGEPLIGEGVWIGAFTLIDGSGGLTIGKGVNVSSGAQILTHSSMKRTLSERKYPEVDRQPTSIGDHCFIGTNATILMGSTLGHHCVVAAGAVIKEGSSFPPYSLIAGVPAVHKGDVRHKLTQQAHSLSMDTQQNFDINPPEKDLEMISSSPSSTANVSSIPSSNSSTLSAYQMGFLRCLWAGGFLFYGLYLSVLTLVHSFWIEPLSSSDSFSLSLFSSSHPLSLLPNWIFLPLLLLGLFASSKQLIQGQNRFQFTLCLLGFYSGSLIFLPPQSFLVILLFWTGLWMILTPMGEALSLHSQPNWRSHPLLDQVFKWGYALFHLLFLIALLNEIKPLNPQLNAHSLSLPSLSLVSSTPSGSLSSPFFIHSASLFQMTLLFALEASGCFFFLFKLTRPIGWSLWIVAYCIAYSSNQLNGGNFILLIMSHFFLFESSWLPPKTLRISSKPPIESPIVYFDGVCTLCNTVVDFIIAEDQSQSIRFASIQGKAGSQIQIEEVQRGESMAFQKQEQIWTRSTGALHLASELGGIWRLFAMTLYIPALLRDYVYEIVQKNRYRWFGKEDRCRLPTPQERARFLE